MKAFVLLKAPAPRSGGIVHALRKMKEVQQAWALYGEQDVIVEVEVQDLHHLDRLVMRNIQALPQVESSRTYIVIEDEDVYLKPDGPHAEQP